MGTELLTAEDYFRVTPPDSHGWELIDGALVVSAKPTLWHQELVGRLYEELRRLHRRKVARVWMDVDNVLGEHDVLGPDLVVIKTERLRIAEPHAVVGAPDLAIEVLSPSTRRRDERDKSRIYARAGVETLWLVDPDDRRVDVYRLDGRRYARPMSVRPPTSLKWDVPRFEIDLARLFEPL
jgi:Uma2 family endonuclease